MYKIVMPPVEYLVVDHRRWSRSCLLAGWVQHGASALVAGVPAAGTGSDRTRGLLRYAPQPSGGGGNGPWTNI